ncbi:MAG: hypothetical protein V2B19_12870 [Pseudomonadota bacterium]
MKLTTSCALEASDDACGSGRDAQSCPCCIGEEASRACNDSIVSPYSLSSGSIVPRTPDAHSGGALAVTGVHMSAISFVTANSSGNIRNPFLIESAIHRSIFSIILLM